MIELVAFNHSANSSAVFLNVPRNRSAAVEIEGSVSSLIANDLRASARSFVETRHAVSMLTESGWTIQARGCA